VVHVPDKATSPRKHLISVRKALLLMIAMTEQIKLCWLMVQYLYQTAYILDIQDCFGKGYTLAWFHLQVCIRQAFQYLFQISYGLFK
jgi:hypothetical protein